MGRVKKREMLGVNAASYDIDKQEKVEELQAINNLHSVDPATVLDKIPESWSQDTKDMARLIVCEIKLFGILYHIDIPQLMTAFELYDKAIKLEITKLKDTSLDDATYIKYARLYKDYITQSFSMLRDYFVNPATRMKAMLAIANSATKPNEEALKLLRG